MSSDDRLPPSLRPSALPELPIEAQSSPPSSSSCPSKKCLCIDSKSTRDSVSPSTDSANSADSSSEKVSKRTREQPNLSDCHCCGIRVNHTNPKERLQPLDSVWRIVLLCKKCLKRVELGQSCPYCFKDTPGNEEICVRCKDCLRRIHKVCVVTYGNSPPWSLCGSISEMFICIDCWIPKFLVNSVRFRRRIRNTKINSKPRVDSRVSDNYNCLKSLEDAVKDANHVLEKKLAAAANAKDKALRKAVVAKNALELKNNVLELMGQEINGAKCDLIETSSSGIEATETTALDDAELAFKLHREMNSSPRISKNLCTVNSTGKDSLLGRRNSSTNVHGRLEDCSKSKLNRTVPEPSDCMRASGSGSCSSSKLSNHEMRIYKRKNLKRKNFQTSNGVELDIGLVGNCNSYDENTVASESVPCLKQDHLVHDSQLNDTQVSCSSTDVNTNGNADRYLLKYSKRPVGSKPLLDSANEFLFNDSPHENHASALELPLNCSNESRTFTNVPNQSHSISLHAFACVMGLSREQP